jgi:hypothetical protein
VPRGAEMEEYCKGLPEYSVLVWYSDDHVWHERMVLVPVRDTKWVVRAPDSDREIEDIGGADPRGCPERMSPLHEDGTIPGVIAEGVYRFRSYPRDAEFKGLLRDVRGLAGARKLGHELTVPRQLRAPGGDVLDMNEFFGGNFLPRRLPSNGPVRLAQLPPLAAPAPSPSTPSLAFDGTAGALPPLPDGVGPVVDAPSDCVWVASET